MAKDTFPERKALTPLLMLKQSRSLCERGWAQGTLARDKAGIPIHPQAEGACSWCMSGALHRVAASDKVNARHFDQAWYALDEAALMEGWPGPTFTAWNDEPGRTQAEVLAAFDKAIAILTPAAGPAAVETETKDV